MFFVGFGTGVVIGTALVSYNHHRKAEYYNSHLIEDLQNKLAKSCLTNEESIVEHETWYDTDIPIRPSGGRSWREYYSDVFDINLEHARNIHQNRKIDLVSVEFKPGEGFSYDEVDVKAVYRSSPMSNITSKI